MDKLLSYQELEPIIEEVHQSFTSAAQFSLFLSSEMGIGLENVVGPTDPFNLAISKVVFRLNASRRLGEFFLALKVARPRNGNIDKFIAML